MATYFIRISAYHQGSNARFVGPFKSRTEADMAINRAQMAEDSQVVLHWQTPRDITRAVQVLGVAPATVSRRNFGMTERNTLSRIVPLDTADLLEHEKAFLPY